MIHNITLYKKKQKKTGTVGLLRPPELVDNNGSL